VPSGARRADRLGSRPGLAPPRPAAPSLLERDGAPPAPRLALRALVESSLEVLELALELAKAFPPLRGQRAVGDRGPDRAAGRAVVGAVREAALCLELDDVLERLLEALLGFPELELPHAGRVDDQPSLGQQHELTPGRRMAAATVVADLARVEELLAGERV